MSDQTQQPQPPVVVQPQQSSILRDVFISVVTAVLTAVILDKVLRRNK